jgi:hypothetical protein
VISVFRSVERVLEVVISAPILGGELEGLADLTEASLMHPAERLLVCVDATRMRILPPEQAQALIDALRRQAPNLLRGAFLLPRDHAALWLQMTRVLREARGPDIRCFMTPTELVGWLSPALSPAERERVRGFYRGVDELRSW